jgi:large subunit ribosomal protein L6
MSRVGKHPVAIPSGVECRIEGLNIVAKGKLGELTARLTDEVGCKIEDGKIWVSPLSNSKTARMMWGTARRLIDNIVRGVSEGFSRQLEINGVGYRAAVQGHELLLNLGYSHEVRYPIPAHITITCEKPTAITIRGANLQQVGQVAAEIRSYREPEPYKGKGIKYANEFIFRKEGKKK